MKKSMNFRFSPIVVQVLEDKAERLNISKTEVIEKSLLKDYVKPKKKKVHGLMQFAGVLKDYDYTDFLKDIKKSRRNKTIKLPL